MPRKTKKTKKSKMTKKTRLGTITKWEEAVAAVLVSNPNMDVREAMAEAAKTYGKKSKTATKASTVKGTKTKTIRLSRPSRITISPIKKRRAKKKASGGEYFDTTVYDL